MLYIPFEPVSLSLFEDLLARGYSEFVLQRFQWPGIEKGTAFLLSVYADQQLAAEHGHHLQQNEGKVLSGQLGVDKINKLLESGSGYRIFLNKIKDNNWEKRMLKYFKVNIVNYLQQKTRFKRTDPLDILFTLEHGRVIAVIDNGKTKKIVSALELIS